MSDYKYLAHFGIKGMHWGERRWQDYAGKLTSAGRIRYGVGQGLHGGIFDSSKSVSGRAKKLVKFGSALGKAKAEQYSQSAKRGLYKARQAAKSVSRELRSQRSTANQLLNRARQLDYYTKKNSALRQIMQRYADVAYLSDRRFETRATAGRMWVSNALRPLQTSRWDTPRMLLSKAAPVTRDMQGSFGAVVRGKYYSAKKTHDTYGAWPTMDDPYRKSWY